jgi:hypothetical protein
VRTVLIVSPNFPPVNAADMHRVRMSLPYYEELGWRPIVLSVRPDLQDLPIDNGLLETVPADVPVLRTGAIPARWSRMAGIGNIGLRAFGHLAAAGGRLIRSEHVDLVFFSSTMFTVLALGRIWKRRFGVPYVIDLQDAWFSTYYDDKPRSERPPKYAGARLLHRTLESWTMRRVDGVVAVSDAYLDTMRQRYPWITSDRCAMIPFGAAERDFEIAARRRTPVPSPDPARPTGLYVGRAGPDMATALRIVCGAMAQASSGRLAQARLEFVGTDYATGARARKTVEPIAAELGLGARVSERTDRIPYLDALGRLTAADFLLLIGSDDPQYSPSKVYPYLLAGRPLIVVVHERSPIVELARRAGAAIVVTFTSREDVAGPAARLAAAWASLLDRLLDARPIDRDALAPLMARTLAARQCQMFERAIQPATAAEVAACTE